MNKVEKHLIKAEKLRKLDGKFCLLCRHEHCPVLKAWQSISGGHNSLINFCCSEFVDVSQSQPKEAERKNKGELLSQKEMDCLIYHKGSLSVDDWVKQIAQAQLQKCQDEMYEADGYYRGFNAGYEEANRQNSQTGEKRC